MCVLLYQFPWWRVEFDGLDIDCNVSFGCHSLETGCWSQRAFRVENTARLKDFFENFEKPKYPLFPLWCPSLPLFFASLRPIASMRTWRCGTKMGDIDSQTPPPTFFCHHLPPTAAHRSLGGYQPPTPCPAVARNSACRCRSLRSEQLKWSSSDIASVCSLLNHT